ncbi:uncharacterized protein LOC115968681 [Quercus lobata]|uniref:uncharacterized protein LOC115968681 n=1 Tax=Quercus lobata TaxID=97700 RepID=UPI0012458346|nr:uncharacterized protein LOC115968681 [Quercus lobata]
MPRSNLFRRRALLRIMIPSIEGKCTSSRIGLLASVQVLLEQVGELKILNDMKKCDHGIQIIQHHDFFLDDCLGEYLLLFPKLLKCWLDKERAAVRPEQSTSQYLSSNSANTENLSSTSRPGLIENEDRLPGAVLLARARLLERLRGVPLSANSEFLLLILLTSSSLLLLLLVLL